MAVESFPQYLSSPYQVLWWESDEVAIIIIGYIMANTFGKFFELSLWALLTWSSLFGLPILYKYFKNKYPSGFLKHMLYFTGIKNVPYCPSFFIKNFSE